MDLTTVLHSIGTAMIVGTIYGLLFAVLQTRALLFSRRNKKTVIGITLLRTSLFFTLHYVMRPILALVNPAIYTGFLFIFFLLAVFLYTKAKKH